mmetsp:Transcript_127811/g.255263  ORF Transcript_127811/g.255263 Transcript_127811/m.255263 type:complete len:94 (+) Transcript_127811:252-533(+)
MKILPPRPWIQPQMFATGVSLQGPGSLWTGVWRHPLRVRLAVTAGVQIVKPLSWEHILEFAVALPQLHVVQTALHAFNTGRDAEFLPLSLWHL